ncbi:uncharacterized protein L201_006749 [Kwoniella dendrophila CBS 6074]|uniref:Uncharacterized protein n=1 Tax=Kwoniella dendrophila CBS 6074 TaxID=1295534 RepID=A0AAX4K2K0_9TREE
MLGAPLFQKNSTNAEMGLPPPDKEIPPLDERFTCENGPLHRSISVKVYKTGSEEPFRERFLRDFGDYIYSENVFDDDECGSLRRARFVQRTDLVYEFQPSLLEDLLTTGETNSIDTANTRQFQANLTPLHVVQKMYPMLKKDHAIEVATSIAEEASKWMIKRTEQQSTMRDSGASRYTAESSQAETGPSSSRGNH